MATIVSATPTGFSIDGLTRPWNDGDLAPLARDIGALCVAWGDVMQQSLVVVCDTMPLERDKVLLRLISILQEKALYSRRQEVTFSTLDSKLTLISFEDGLPDGDHIAYRAAHPAINDVVWGNRHMIVVRADDAKPKDWQAALNAVWQRLRMNGVVSNVSSELPDVELPWQPARDTGQIVMLDQSLAVVLACQPIHSTFDPDDYRDETLPIVISGSDTIVLAAGDNWPPEERTVLSHAGMRFHIEVGRTATALGEIGFVDLDAPVVIL